MFFKSIRECSQVQAHGCSTGRRQKRASDALELKLQIRFTAKGVLGTNVRSSASAACALSAEPSPQPLDLFGLLLFPFLCNVKKKLIRKVLITKK